MQRAEKSLNNSSLYYTVIVVVMVPPITPPSEYKTNLSQSFIIIGIGLSPGPDLGLVTPQATVIVGPQPKHCFFCFYVNPPLPISRSFDVIQFNQPDTFC